MCSVSKVQVCHLTPNQQKEVTRLVGSKCIVECCLQGVHTRALWDMGAQVSIVPQSWMMMNLPDTRLREIKELMEIGEQFQLTAANGTTIPFEGWVELEFRLNKTVATQGMTVPFLVSSGIEQPIIGYNVIELLVKDEGSSASTQSAFPGLRPAQFEALVGFIQNNDSDDFCEVRLGKRDALVPTGKSIVVMGRAHPGPVHEEMMVLFEPDVRRCWADDLQIDESVVKVSTGSCCKVSILVTNTGSRPVTLRKRTILGRLQLVHSIMPADLQPSVMAMSDKPTQIEKNDKKWDPQVDLSHLSEEQQQTARKMLREKCHAFGRDKSDTECAPDLKM